MEDLRYWIGFNLVRGIGPARVRRLLECFGSLEAAWRAPSAALARSGLDQRSLENLLAARGQIDLDQALRRLEQIGARALTWDSPDYPPNLLNIAQPPPVLYVRGDFSPTDEWAVAIVGTRKASVYGREAARQIAGDLAARGVTVVSGLARGIDAVAHRAALEAGGRTLAVLGSGLAQIYPPEHRALAEDIARSGAVVSDYPVDMAPEAANFPPRNRLISGLARGVLIVEAGEGSGALITADYAAEQGRDVFAVPGSILQPSCLGANRLIQQGARLVTGAQDVLDELDLVRAADFTQARMIFPADETEGRLLGLLGAEPAHIDEIGARSGLPMAQVASALAMMELKGLARQVGGMNYVAGR